MDLLFKNICMQSIWIHSLILWYPLSKNICQNVMYLMTECTLKNKDYKIPPPPPKKKTSVNILIYVF